MSLAGMVFLLNLDDGLAGVVFPVRLARVVFARGVHRPRDVFAIPTFADDDENVVHLTVVEPCPAPLDPGGDGAVRVGGQQPDRGRDLRHVAAVLRLRYKVPPWCR